MMQANSLESVTRRVPELEGLRGVLASWVLTFHVLAISGWWTRLPASVQSMADGANAVDVFILLSGFVIAGLLLSRQEPYLVFLFRRYARLMPVFLICLIAALAVQAMGYMPMRYTPHDLPALLAANLSLMHGTIPESQIQGASGAILNPAWSISLEWQFYLFAPVLVALLSRGGARFIAVSVACIVAYRLALPHLIGFSGAFLPFKIHLFWIGCVSFLAYRWFESNTLHRNSGQAAALAVLLAFILLLPYKQNVGLLIWMAAMVMLTGQWRGVWRVLGSRPIVALGAISYPLYLVHEVIIWLLLGVWLPVGLWGLSLFFAAVFILTVTVSWALHVGVEKPANQSAKKLFISAG